MESSSAAIKNAEVRLWKASQDFERYQNLLNENSTTRQQYDAAKAEKDAAEAQLTVLKKQLETAVKQTKASASQTVSTQKQADVAQTIVEQRKADLEYALLQLGYTIVTAPVDGVISKKSVQTGQYVNAGQMLFSIVANDKLWVVANFKETQLEKIKPGQSVEIEVDAFDKQPIKGRITSFSRATGAKFSLLPPDNATGNFVKVVQRVPVKIEFTEKPALAKQLSAGMSVKVVVRLDEGSSKAPVHMAKTKGIPVATEFAQ
jgi:membrane fusion protein (multidrug efflux system)